MPENRGFVPDECKVFDDHGEVIGFRAVHVRLFGGYDSKKAGHAPWPAAGGRPPTIWKISRPPHPFEIESYELS